MMMTMSQVIDTVLIVWLMMSMLVLGRFDRSDDDDDDDDGILI